MFFGFLALASSRFLILLIYLASRSSAISASAKNVERSVKLRHRPRLVVAVLCAQALEGCTRTNQRRLMACDRNGGRGRQSDRPTRARVGYFMPFAARREVWFRLAPNELMQSCNGREQEESNRTDEGPKSVPQVAPLDMFRNEGASRRERARSARALALLCWRWR